MEVSGPQNLVCLLFLRCDHIGFGLHLLQGRAFFQTADYPVRGSVSVGGIVSEACGVPDVRRAFLVQLWRKEEFESRRQHAHDQGTTAPAAQHAAAENGRAGAIAPLPVLVTQDYDCRQRSLGLRSRRAARLRLWGLRFAIRFREITTKGYFRAKQPEDVRRDICKTDLLRRAVLPRHGHATSIDASDVLKRRLSAVAKVKEIGVCKRPVF